MVKVVAGVSKASLDIRAAGASFCERRHELAGTWLRSLEVTRVVMEATGRYHRRVYQCLHDRGFEVVLPAAGPAFRRSVGPSGQPR